MSRDSFQLLKSIHFQLETSFQHKVPSTFTLSHSVGFQKPTCSDSLENTFTFKTPPTLKYAGTVWTFQDSSPVHEWGEQPLPGGFNPERLQSAGLPNWLVYQTAIEEEVARPRGLSQQLPVSMGKSWSDFLFFHPKFE